jgi:hypothetical protein
MEEPMRIVLRATPKSKEILSLLALSSGLIASLVLLGMQFGDIVAPPLSHVLTACFAVLAAVLNAADAMVLKRSGAQYRINIMAVVAWLFSALVFGSVAIAYKAPRPLITAPVNCGKYCLAAIF